VTYNVIRIVYAFAEGNDDDYGVEDDYDEYDGWHRLSTGMQLTILFNIFQSSTP